MIFGMSTACFFPDLYTEQAISVIGEMGVKDIEIFFSCLSEYKESFVSDIKNRIIDNGLNVYSVHALSLQFEPQLFSRHKRARQDSIDIFKQVLEAGACLDAKVYVFHGPSNVKHARKLVLDYPYIAEHASYLSETAKEYGIKLAWENVHWCWYAKPEFASRLLEFPSLDNLYFTLDMKQAAQAGYDPADFVEHTKGRLVNVHVCDYAKSEEHGICPVLPFKGETNFYKLRNALIENGYDDAMILEVYKNNYSNYQELTDNLNKIKSFFSATV